MISGNLLLQQVFHGKGEGFQYLPFLHDRDALEGIDIIGMNGEKGNEFFHSLVHGAVATGKGNQVIPNAGLLFDTFFQ